jgi:hypothetical protein
MATPGLLPIWLTGVVEEVLVVVVVGATVVAAKEDVGATPGHLLILSVKGTTMEATLVAATIVVLEATTPRSSVKSTSSSATLQIGAGTSLKRTTSQKRGMFRR